MEAAQRSVSILSQRQVEHFVKWKVEFQKMRELNLFEETRKRRRDGTEASKEDKREGDCQASSVDAGESSCANVVSKKERYAAGVLEFFSSIGIELTEDVVLKALSNQQCVVKSAVRTLERSYWKYTVFKAGAVVYA